MTNYIIGIAGGTGSGKSTFAERLVNEFRNNISVLYFDNYYRRQDALSAEERKNVNYDHPDALESELLAKHLRELKSGRSISSPLYDFTIHNRSERTIMVEPRKIILVEGIFALQYREILDMLDLKIYVETDADERILRRVRRDISERGRSLDDIISQYLGTVKPMHYLFVEPTKANADIIINGGMNETAFNVICCKIRSVI